MGNTVTIPSVEIFATGTHNHDFYDLADLQAMISAANEVGFTPPVKIGHMADTDTKALLKHEGLPAFGWIKNLRMKGEKLVGDLTEVPRRIAELIRNGAYRRLSAEIYWNFAQNGKSWPRVLKAVSLLGAEVPAVTTLKDVEALYGARPYAANLPAGEVKTYMGAIAVTAPPTAVLMQKGKADVGYREAGDDADRCGRCRAYLGLAAPGAVGACGLVAGEIASDATCELHELREAFAIEKPEAYAAGGFGNAREVGAGCAKGEETELDTNEHTDFGRIDAIDAEVTHRVHGYQQEDPRLTFEAAYRQLPQRAPELWRSYRDRTHARLVPSGDDRTERRQAAGQVVLARARSAKDGIGIERAIRQVLAEDGALTKAYAGTG